LTICDVGPRDGLQNEPETLAPHVRAEFVNRLADAGLPRIEAASFVRADAVPQMAGAEEVVAAIERRLADHVALARRLHVVDRDPDRRDRLALVQLLPERRAHAVVDQRVADGA